MFGGGRSLGGNGKDFLEEKKVSDTRLKGPLSAKAASEGIRQMEKCSDLTKYMVPHSFDIFHLGNFTL